MTNLNIKNNIYLVVSLPKTGTTSLTKMAKICGLESIHVLGNNKFSDLLLNGYTFFADTPFYNPEFLLGILESLSEEYKINFIYSDREEYSWETSFKKLINKWNYPKSLPQPNKKKLSDYIFYRNFYKNQKIHYDILLEISKIYNIPILNYKFEDGWKPFCDFLKCETPNVELPHLNKSQITY